MKEQLLLESNIAQLSLPAAFAIPPVPTLGYCSEVVQDRAYIPGSITLRHRFCAAAQMEIALRVIEGLVFEIAARERVPLLDMHIMVALPYIGQSFMQSGRLTPNHW